MNKGKSGRLTGSRPADRAQSTLVSTKGFDPGRVADKLREARALIEQRGWCQRFYQNEAGCLCAYGAMQLATAGDAEEESDPRTKPVEEAFGRATGLTWVAQWNDAPERTQAEVLAAFDKAIELAEQEVA